MVRLPNGSRTLPLQCGRFASLAHDTGSRKMVRESVLLRFDAVPATLKRYFQQILPLAKCDAEDGPVVGQLLVEIVSSNPKDLARAIREFVDRTAMLRDCGFAHIGDMLARLLSADVHGGPDDETTVVPSTLVTAAAVVIDPSSLTDKQAIAIGSAIASNVRQAHPLKKVIEWHGVLHAMKLEYAWFVPMLEVVMAHKAAERRRSAVMNGLRSTGSIIASLAPSDVASDADAADEESGFSSVVRLGAPHAPLGLMCVCIG